MFILGANFIITSYFVGKQEEGMDLARNLYTAVFAILYKQRSSKTRFIVKMRFKGPCFFYMNCSKQF